ncbi:lysophospholipid acyltransferase family protein [Micromonospora rifamycinica]|uniref:1-acyl-sn-glycerol-3-phosphate acyltransferases n=1 Tax=Micromonospora rifamycinica TaxID=291594 RepID=A0A120F7S6_9ACTN|nr:lysophospholipid acyltransferase family protein [Micromonospora rifamycinica]KWV30692.1 glycerol acyltransferase [Micromonospora rifamycinica]SCG79821.1 1-acyl-sn-glycerol-3-phosphate acyltransferases [Micromonospora rifamycinica]
MSAELWRPTAGCGPACLPGVRRAQVSPARRVARLLGVLGMVLVGAGVVVLLPVLPAAERAAVVRSWARGTAGALGVRLAVRGRLPRRRALLVANHVSWLDILAVLAVAPARLLAKREVRRWPVLGLLARAGGALFVDRSRPRELPHTVARIAATLRAGHPVAVFPEGTTWCGVAPSADCRPRRGFRPAVFQAAIDAGAPVVPLRISYRSATTGATTTTAAFLGDETLWRSVRRVLAARDLVVDVAVTAALHPAPGADRRLLARTAESAVHLLPPRLIPGRPTLAVVGPVGVPGSVSAPAAGAGLGLAA